MNAELKPYLTPSELTVFLPVGRSVIYRELRAGRIPSMKIGRKIVIPRVAFERWLSECGGLPMPEAAQ
jgi:excisionase family DNA binding protein